MDIGSLGLIANLDIRTKQHKKALEDYYLKHPEEEPKDWLKTMLEFGVPTALGYGLKRSKIPMSPDLRRYLGGLGIGIGTLTSGLGFAGRNQKHLREEGVESNLLGYKTRPLILDPNKKNFNY